MKKNPPFAHSGLIARLLILFAITFVCLLIALIPIGIGSLLTTYTGSIPSFNLKLQQLISAIFTFILPSLAMAFFISRRPMRYLELTHFAQPAKFILTFLSMIFLMPLLQYIIEWNASIQLPEALHSIEAWMQSKEEEMNELTLLILKTDSWIGWLFNLFLVGVVAAVGEELYFRGILQNLFRDKWRNKHVAVWLSAFCFSFIHLQFYGFFPRMILGAYFGYLVVWTGSLWIPILAHFTNNALALFEIYMEQHQINLDSLPIPDSSHPIYFIPYLIGSTILFILAAYCIRRTATKETTRDNYLY